MALFPPQRRDWALPSECGLTPRAAERLAREAAQHSDAEVADALRRDWGGALDGKQVQRWANAFGSRLAAERDAEVRASESGLRPVPPANAVELLVIGPDGGRVQMREPDPESGNRWREDKVFTVTSYQPGDGKEQKPQPLVTTHVASMEKTEMFGRFSRVEGERRGWRRAQQVIAIADCGNWIDPLLEREFPGIPRIADWYHAEERLHDCGKAAYGHDTPQAKAHVEKWKSLLAAGRAQDVLDRLKVESQRLGAPRAKDPEEHPRRILGQAVGYFEKNQGYMNYPEYRSKGWPIGSGNTEAGVKQFNKRVKGSERFWSEAGVEAILCLRALWLSQDRRWDRYWSNRPAYLLRAA
jgi:hypothetical protein